MSTSRRQKPYADPTGRFARILERHEARIARHTAIQSNIAALQLLFGVVTTGLLIYVAVLQFQAADRQATIADRQAKLEYAKVAPQFAITATLLPTVRSSAIEYAFPKQIQLRIVRGEASIDKVEVAQEVEISRIHILNGNRVHDSCVLRLTDYFERKPASWTDWVASQTFQKPSVRPCVASGRSNARFCGA